LTTIDLATAARAIIADHVPSAMKDGMEIEFTAPARAMEQAWD
jgi:hypothetical protein